MTEYTTVYVPGKVYWAKIIGQKALHDNYDKTFGGENPGREWSYELVPDDVAFLKTHRLLDRLKDNPDDKNPDKGDFLRLKKPEFTKDGDKNDPISVVDEDQNEWDGRLLGNGTSVVAKLTVADFGKGKKKALWTQAIMVTDLVPYESEDGDGEYSGRSDFSEFTGKKAKPKPKAPTKAKTKSDPVLDDLDDDMPF